jgi:hypothetical protein
MAREISKFLSGFAGNQVITHGALAASGTHFAVFGINYTPELNTIAAIVWAVALVLLVYYAWLRPVKK